jgi:cytidylate kinase
MRQASTIAIDGPAASGKSAVGMALARRLGYRFFDTGAMYRGMTWAALRRGVDVHDEMALERMARAAVIVVRDTPGDAIEPTGVTIDGDDATSHLRDPEVDANVSLVSRVSGVRTVLVRIQRELAAAGGVAMAGRDIGTVVLPDAGVKVYLDASREVRAARRAEQMREAGLEPNLEALMADLGRRDGIDSAREASPLTAAVDAEIINTDALTIEEVVRRIEALARG